MGFFPHYRHRSGAYQYNSNPDNRKHFYLYLWKMTCAMCLCERKRFLLLWREKYIQRNLHKVPILRLLHTGWIMNKIRHWTETTSKSNKSHLPKKFANNHKMQWNNKFKRNEGVNLRLKIDTIWLLFGTIFNLANNFLYLHSRGCVYLMKRKHKDLHHLKSIWDVNLIKSRSTFQVISKFNFRSNLYLGIKINLLSFTASILNHINNTG